MNLILSPHYDDAVLSLGGLLAKEGGESVVITCFAGKPSKNLFRPWDLLSGFWGSDASHEMRKEENRKALSLLGVPAENIRGLPHLDSQYRLGGPPEAALSTSIKSILDSFSDAPVNVYAPALEEHPDHALVKECALALKDSYPHFSFYLYEDLPYALTGKGVEGHEASSIELTDVQLEQKLEAIRCYASQIRPLSVAFGPRFLERIREHGAEVVYRIQ